MKPAALAMLVVVSGCVAIPHPEARDLPAAIALRADATLDDLAVARSLYVRKCAGCHGLHVPAEFDDATWRRHVDAMRERANATRAEADAVWWYLAAMNDRGGA